MKVVLDQVEMHGCSDSISDAIERAAEDAANRGRMVVEVRVDRHLVEDVHLGQADQDHPGAQEVSMTTMAPCELLFNTFTEAGNATEESIEQAGEAAELIQSGRTVEAMDRMKEFLATWESINAALSQGLQLLGIDPEEGQFEQRPIARVLEDVHARLECLAEAIRSDDHSGLSDVLGHEFPETARSMGRLLTHLGTCCRNEG